ncbi:MAG: MerR family transcriptional regulator [candidate division WOR-3 bacterium]
MNLNPDLKKNLMTIGEVIDYLKKYFDNVTSSKLRFYEKEGLIIPKRTKGGHRLYCSESVKILRLILEMREKYRMSLPEVKVFLSRIKKDKSLLLLFEEIVKYSDLTFERADLSELERRYKFSKDHIKKLEKIGLIVKCPKTGKYYGESLKLIDILNDLANSGVDLEKIYKIIEKVKEISEIESQVFSVIKENGIKLFEVKEKISRLKDILFVLYLKKFLLEKGSNPSKKEKREL